MNTKDTRVIYIDQISGLLIIYMIVYHILQWCDLNYINRSYWMLPLSFFMFWFFYKSGMFYKEKTCNEIIIGGGKKLMVPYVVYSIIGHILNCIRKVMMGDCNWIHYVLSPFKQIALEGAISGNAPLWFLPTLLIVQLLYTKMSQILRDEYIIILSLCTAWALFVFKITQPLYLGNIALGVAVYAVGHFMKNLQFKNMTLVLSLVLYFIVLLFVPSRIDFHTNDCGKGYYWLAIVFSLSGCVVVNNLFKKFPYSSFKFFENIGRCSMNLYVQHWPIIIVCFMLYPFHGWAMFLAIITTCIVLLFIINESHRKLYRIK